MGSASNLATYNTSANGSDTVITVTFNGSATGTITLAGIIATKDDLNVVASPIAGEDCAGLLKLSTEFPEAMPWSATLTAGNLQPFVDGCWESAAIGKCSILLTDNTFTFGGTSYQVIRLYEYQQPGVLGQITFELDEAMSRSWTLHVGQRAFSLADATLSSGDRLAGWDFSANRTVQPGQEIQVQLTYVPYR